MKSPRNSPKRQNYSVIIIPIPNHIFALCPQSPHISHMLKFTPILLALAYGFIMYHFSVRRTARELNAKSTELADPMLKVLTDRIAQSLDIDRIRVYIYEIEPV
ncbi:MAG: hypothetical protein ACU0CA_05755, partial [Paracoccaceae bacterium]